MIDLIGLAGFARCGKDTFSTFAKTEFLKKNIPCLSLSLADEVKNDLDNLTTMKLGISAFTEDTDEKSIIRPLLICWGTDVIRNNVDENYWIKKIEKDIYRNQNKGTTSIITDIRFQNELEWVQENEGKVIWVEREGTSPQGHVEELETASIKKYCDIVFSWPQTNNLNLDGSNAVKNLLEENGFI